jgi:hypothetical protein
MDIVKRLRVDEAAYDADDMDLHQDAADEIERLRGQVEFERASLQAAFGELGKLDGDIERLRKALEIAADGFRDCGAEDLEDMCRAAIVKATGGE